MVACIKNLFETVSDLPSDREIKSSINIKFSDHE